MYECRKGATSTETYPGICVGYGLKGVKMAISTYLQKTIRSGRRPALKKEHLTGTVGLITHLSTNDFSAPRTVQTNSEKLQRRNFFFHELSFAKTDQNFLPAAKVF